MLLTLTTRSLIHIYSMHYIRELRSIDFDQPISALALCADGKTLAVGTTTGEILIYDLRGVITPLYSTRGHDAGAAINSLQFATSSTESSVASVFPQGVPVVSGREQTSPGKNNGETLQEVALRKLESLGMGNTYASGPPSPTSAVRSQPSSPTRQSMSPRT